MMPKTKLNPQSKDPISACAYRIAFISKDKRAFLLPSPLESLWYGFRINHFDRQPYLKLSHFPSARSDPRNSCRIDAFLHK